ncbi:hypothetical protein R1flu_026951 [Riccia fluitans]|uniref:Uncharacterized protein n=1 Tax=Riccia fluitans TaxID=41844 RepID=A0ABD1XHE1_9MARC
MFVARSRTGYARPHDLLSILILLTPLDLKIVDIRPSPISPAFLPSASMLPLHQTGELERAPLRYCFHPRGGGPTDQRPKPVLHTKSFMAISNFVILSVVRLIQFLSGAVLYKARMESLL